jgi:Aromatic-ring-opening dioxygenase LigAB, LigA subunit
VSSYALEKLCYRVVHEPALREALASDPEPALRAARPALSEEQIEALLDGDVSRLSREGVDHFLLHQLARFHLFGLDFASYAQQIRAARD